CLRLVCFNELSGYDLLQMWGPQMVQVLATRFRLPAGGTGKIDCRIGRAVVRLQSRSLVTVLVFAFLFLRPAFSADDSGVRRRLTNQDVVAMVSAGISEDVILAKIRTTSASGGADTNYDTSVDGLKALKAANDPELVAKSMI